MNATNATNVMKAMNNALQQDKLTILYDHQPYTPAVATDVLATFRRRGWVPPSEQQVYIDKWEYYKSLANKSH